MKTTPIGEVYGRLTIIGKSGANRHRQQLVLCACACGKTHVCLLASITNGKTKSCGCLKDELTSARFTIHGGTARYARHPLWCVWCSMRNRCYNSKNKSFKWYGGRGVFVCERWSNFGLFVEDMMPTFVPGLWLDRIDNDGPYSPENCRWATPKEQQNNKRCNVSLTHLGFTKTLTEWAEFLGMSYFVIRNRKTRGWSTEEILDTRIFNSHGEPITRA